MAQAEMTRTYESLDAVVNTFDDDGNAYRRKLSTGLKRGEFIPEVSPRGEHLLILKAKPTGVNYTDRRSGKSARKALNPDERMCYTVTPEAYQTALGIYQPAKGTTA